MRALRPHAERLLASASLENPWQRFVTTEGPRRLFVGDRNVTQLRRDYNASLRDVRKLRSFSDQDRDAIRNAFCTAGEYEMDDRVSEVADPGRATSTACT